MTPEALLQLEMSNPLFPTITEGSIGELLVQIRLLQFDVQAAPPIKDSGNDLIAIRCHSFQAIQVKTTAGDTYPVDKLPEFYDLLAVIQIHGEKSNLLLDQSGIFLIPRKDVADAPRQISQLNKFVLCSHHIDEIFGARHYAHYSEIPSF